MKKISIIVGLIALIGITSIVLIKKQKNNTTVLAPSTFNVQNNGSTNVNAVPLNPKSNVVINSTLPSPEGSNKLPQIVRPAYNPQVRMTPPPEIVLMQGCQGVAQGNPEAMRKCFEAKVQSNITAQTNLVKMPDGTILNVAEYTQKVKSGQVAQINNASQQVSNVKMPQTNSGVFK